MNSQKSNNPTERMNDKVLDILIEEAMEQYAADIAEEEIDCEMSEEELRLMEERRDRIYKKTMAQIRREEKEAAQEAEKAASKPRSGKLVRRCVVLVAVLGVAIALALNVSAFRVFLFKTYIDMTGTLLNINTTSIDDDSYDVIELFECKDEMIIPGWLPPGMELTKIRDDAVRISFTYESDETRVTFRQDKIIDKKSTNAVQTEKNMVDVKDCKVLGMEGNIVKIKSETDINSYIATWDSDKVRYQLHANVDERTLEAILASLEFYE